MIFWRGNVVIVIIAYECGKTRASFSHEIHSLSGLLFRRFVMNFCTNCFNTERKCSIINLHGVICSFAIEFYIWIAKERERETEPFDCIDRALIETF